jgi:homoserine dehydrogenase
MQVADRPGVLGKITTAFGRNGVSLESVVQRGRGGSSVPLIFVTHEAERDKLNAALDEIKEAERSRGSCEYLNGAETGIRSRN